MSPESFKKSSEDTPLAEKMTMIQLIIASEIITQTSPLDKNNLRERLDDLRDTPDAELIERHSEAKAKLSEVTDERRIELMEQAANLL